MLERGPELFRLTVYGTPAGAGSKTAMTIGKRGQERRDHTGRLVLVYRPSSKKTEPWMQAVERDAAAGWRGRDVLDGALWVLIDSYEARPKAHFLSDGRLRPEAPAHPDVTETHDSGKLRRATEDALTNARIWADDKRVVDGHDRKHYCDQEAAALEDESWREPRQLIRIGRMKHQTVAEAGIKSPAPAGQEQLLAA
jgi:Holliday junction resolvase RusA-like endonuclease